MFRKASVGSSCQLERGRAFKSSAPPATLKVLGVLKAQMTKVTEASLCTHGASDNAPLTSEVRIPPELPVKWARTWSSKNSSSSFVPRLQNVAESAYIKSRKAHCYVRDFWRSGARDLRSRAGKLLRTCNSLGASGRFVDISVNPGQGGPDLHKFPQVVYPWIGCTLTVLNSSPRVSFLLNGWICTLIYGSGDSRF